MDCAGHGASIDGIDYAECRLKIAVGDTGLCALGDEVEDGSSRRLRASPCGCRHGDEREKLVWDGQALAERCIDEVEEISLW